MKLLHFPARNDVAGEARTFANNVDAGEYGRMDAALVITTGETLQCHYWGDSLDVIQAIGVLEAAKANLVRKLIGE